MKAFAHVEHAGMGVIVKVPLDSGRLTGKYDAGSTFADARRRWSAEPIRRRARRVEAIRFVTHDGAGRTRAALRFFLTFPVVTTVIPAQRFRAPCPHPPMR